MFDTKHCRTATTPSPVDSLLDEVFESLAGPHGYDRSDPTRGSDFRSPLFDFCRRLKAIAELRGRSAEEALAIVDCWRKDRGIDWCQFSEELTDDEEAEVEFITTWEKIRFAEGEGPLDKAIAIARQKPLKFRNMTRTRPRYKLFLSIAYWLQREQGEQNIYLPCDLVANLLGWNPMYVCRCRQVAEKQGYLRKVKPHRFGGGQPTATEMRFEVDRFDPVTLVELP